MVHYCIYQYINYEMDWVMLNLYAFTSTEYSSFLILIINEFLLATQSGFNCVSIHWFNKKDWVDI